MRAASSASAGPGIKAAVNNTDGRGDDQSTGNRACHFGNLFALPCQ
mgnify:CR=1 FL=1